MPKRALIDHAALGERLLSELRLRGLTSGADLCARFDISQPTLSRLIRKNAGLLLTAGSARRTQYAALRPVDTLPLEIPVYEVSSGPSPPRHLLTLHAISPRGFWCEGASAGVESRFYGDLPYFLFDLQPSGFLGRIVPRLYQHEHFPTDIGLWSQAQTLRYLHLYGWDLPGNLLVGEPALQLFLETRRDHAYPGVSAHERADLYPQMAQDILGYGVPGSSAGGEQPKFLTIRCDGTETTPVLVKFSPPARDPVGIRLADLLVCEHIAHGVLAESGQPSARSALVFADDRTFLEVERFDRLQTPHQRRGVISMRALDAEFVGFGEGWREIARALASEQIITAADEARIAWLDTFGEVIANTDMHCGNLAFWMQGLTVAGLAPCYDMTCMRYAPYHGHLHQNPLALRDSERPTQAVEAGLRFWQRVREHPHMSPDMRQIAAENAQVVARSRGYFSKYLKKY